ncbi:MFS transporter, partial [Pseudorhodobacter sp.]|uniref:MFS transporter n=1 Tax=Pseudorhodobacter sp. TaxID=1934400 RepID=UPI002647F6EC
MPTNSLSIARAPLCAFAVMGMMWGTFAAVLPDLKTMLGVDEATLGLLLFLTPVTAVLAMLGAPAFGSGFGRLALPLATLLMAVSFALPGQTASLLLFPLAMLACGAATGLTDVLMNARVAALENAHARPLMNLCYAIYSLGYALGALVTGALRDNGAGPGLIMGAMAALTLVMALFTWERDGRIDGLTRPADRDAAALGVLPLIGGAIVLVAFMTENAAESWSALHIEKTLGGSPAQGALGPATLALTMAAARLGYLVAPTWVVDELEKVVLPYHLDALKQAAGRIALDGQTMAAAATFVPAPRRGIGLVAQDGALFPHLTIADNIGFGIGRQEPNRETRIAELAYTVGLD